MEELRKAILKLETNFKDVIKWDSRHLKTLKNFTLELNERAVQKDLANLVTKIDSVEEKLEEDIENNASKFKDEKSESLKMNKFRAGSLKNYWKRIVENLMKLRQTCLISRMLSTN